MPTPPVRTITLGLADPHPLSAGTVQRAQEVLSRASTRYQEAGYEIQTVRLSTRPLFDDLADWPAAALGHYTRELQKMLDDVQLDFCSLGTVAAANPAFDLDRLDCIADLVGPSPALNATVLLATSEHGVRTEAALPTAQIMQRLAVETEEGFGNFRFAMLACMPPGSPFFPAAYHAGPSNLSIGVQGAGIVAAALRTQHADGAHPQNLGLVTQWIREALQQQAAPIVELGQQVARDAGLAFGGIDVSPAPLGEDSIVAAMELCGYGPLGSSGTLAVAAAITAALKSSGLPTCGYCGLMLPVLEDVVLGQRWTEGRVDAHRLLLYSSVCGTGLDAVPLPGDSSAASIAHLLLDVATLAHRLNKPLSARLFPVPGKQAGEYTSFTSPYLTNTRI
ncbi:PFL family protein [Reticulibacter mediterranei]|uniref:PFL family protein n=1 Tax=Reticulibacter mediterranei TaxID=2778369 RepID=A0A8J3IKW6_9CHLR|nr:DUF711 family protein [Reticulibacter mediterranei]GHO92071.1 PFL family protein [Reticulibacter mediterranei]